ncbi:MAG: hypothetical protein AAFO95_13115 [Cyanobacteria bacterium J06600_6]
MTAGFGTYFYLNRIKEFISILFLASIISCVINGNTQQNTLNTESGGRKTTIARSFNFNFGLFAAISLIDNLSALGAAKKKQLEKNANSLSFIQLELLKLIKDRQSLSLSDIVIETGLSAEKAKLELQSLLDSDLIITVNGENDRQLIYQTV